VVSKINKINLNLNWIILEERWDLSVGSKTNSSILLYWLSKGTYTILMFLFFHFLSFSFIIFHAMFYFINFCVFSLFSGAEPKQLSSSAALGITLGVFPICGML
jgi:hypothetical protein